MTSNIYNNNEDKELTFERNSSDTPSFDERKDAFLSRLKEAKTQQHLENDESLFVNNVKNFGKKVITISKIGLELNQKHVQPTNDKDAAKLVENSLLAVVNLSSTSKQFSRDLLNDAESSVNNGKEAPDFKEHGEHRGERKRSWRSQDKEEKNNDRVNVEKDSSSERRHTNKRHRSKSPRKRSRSHRRHSGSRERRHSRSHKSKSRRHSRDRHRRDHYYDEELESSSEQYNCRKKKSHGVASSSFDSSTKVGGQFQAEQREGTPLADEAGGDTGQSLRNNKPLVAATFKHKMDIFEDAARHGGHSRPDILDTLLRISCEKSKVETPPLLPSQAQRPPPLPLLPSSSIAMAGNQASYQQHSTSIFMPATPGVQVQRPIILPDGQLLLPHGPPPSLQVDSTRQLLNGAANPMNQVFATFPQEISRHHQVQQQHHGYHLSQLQGSNLQQQRPPLPPFQQRPDFNFLKTDDPRMLLTFPPQVNMNCRPELMDRNFQAGQSFASAENPHHRQQIPFFASIDVNQARQNCNPESVQHKVGTNSSYGQQPDGATSTLSSSVTSDLIESAQQLIKMAQQPSNQIEAVQAARHILSLANHTRLASSGNSQLEIQHILNLAQYKDSSTQPHANTNQACEKLASTRTSHEMFSTAAAAAAAAASAIGIRPAKSLALDTTFLASPTTAIGKQPPPPSAHVGAPVPNLLQTIMNQASLSYVQQQRSLSTPRPPAPPPPPPPPPPLSEPASLTSASSIISNNSADTKTEQFSKLINSTVSNLLAALQTKKQQQQVAVPAAAAAAAKICTDESTVTLVKTKSPPPPSRAIRSQPLCNDLSAASSLQISMAVPLTSTKDSKVMKKRSEKPEAVVPTESVSNDVNKLPTNRIQRNNFSTKQAWQDRIATEVKLHLRPLYSAKKISKKEYKELLKKAVNKISQSGTREIQSDKVKQFVAVYYKKCIKVKRLQHKPDVVSSSE